MNKGNGRANMKVMVVIDESECSYRALMWVLDNLKESIKNLPLVIFAAQPPPNCNYVVSSAFGLGCICPLSATMDLFNSAQQQNKKVALGILEKAKRICASKGVTVEAITEAGYPKEVICDAVQKCGVNLLVIGDEASGNIKRALLGSVSSYCVQNAKCQVLLVRNKA
ncbi:universal stress protein A-like protein [Populus alba x Populus x berolinensis]|nr:universal stress protein A-like protein [Populus alba x Populus x berolinensis]